MAGRAGGRAAQYAVFAQHLPARGGGRARGAVSVLYSGKCAVVWRGVSARRSPDFRQSARVHRGARGLDFIVFCWMCAGGKHMQKITRCVARCHIDRCDLHFMRRQQSSIWNGTAMVSDFVPAGRCPRSRQSVSKSAYYERFLAEHKRLFGKLWELSSVNKIMRHILCNIYN